MPRRFQFAWLFVALLTLSGAPMAPARAGDSTRIVPSMAWFRGDPSPHVRPVGRPMARGIRPAVAPVAIETTALPQRFSPHALFQRPPPRFR